MSQTQTGSYATNCRFSLIIAYSYSYSSPTLFWLCLGPRKEGREVRVLFVRYSLHLHKCKTANKDCHWVCVSEWVNACKGWPLWWWWASVGKLCIKGREIKQLTELSTRSPAAVRSRSPATHWKSADIPTYLSLFLSFFLSLSLWSGLWLQLLRPLPPPTCPAHFGWFTISFWKTKK